MNGPSFCPACMKFSFSIGNKRKIPKVLLFLIFRVEIKTHLNDTVKELIGQHSKAGNNRHATDITELLAITQRIG